MNNEREEAFLNWGGEEGKNNRLSPLHNVKHHNSRGGQKLKFYFLLATVIKI